jgi:septum formation topological specificity factor MinE
MDIRTPPHVDEYASLAEWKQARADFFARLQRRDRTPKMVETVRTEYVDREVERVVHVEVPVEVEKIVYVDREVIREVEAAPVDVPIPDFLRYDPLSEFIANERRDEETDEATLGRLRSEIVDLLALQRDGGLAATEEARLRYLTGHIKLMGD